MGIPGRAADRETGIYNPVVPGVGGHVTIYDSLLPVVGPKILFSESEIARAQLRDVEKYYSKSGNSRGALASLVDLVRRRPSVWNNKLKARLFNDLAGVTVRLKLYPIAMRCYGAEAECVDPDSTFYQQLTTLDTSIATKESEPVAIKEILASFDDGKEASSYAVLVHVKQPVPGRRKSFTHINNVGHTFITLIKYNSDNSYVSRSFGFYPHKTTILSATPLHPGSLSVIKDDAHHDWDEVAGKFITAKKFNRIIEVLQSYEQKAYHLGHNNCTDFGLTLAGIGGITIRETSGHWPLGKGNNPGSAGQSMLEGKLANTDPDATRDLFVNNLPVR